MTATTANPGLETWIERGREVVESGAERRKRARSRRFDTIAVHGMYDHVAAMANQGSLIEPAYLSPAQHFEDADQLEAALA